MSSAVAEEYHAELKPLVDSVREHPEALATGDYGIRDSALQAEKFIFDHSLAYEPIASRHINELLKTLQNYESAPVTRSQTKASAAESTAKAVPPPLPPFSVTPLGSLYLDGMNSDQIWEQLELKTKNVLKVLESIVTTDSPEEAGSEGSSDYDRDDANAVLSGDHDELGSDEEMDLDMNDLDKYDEVDSEAEDDSDDGDEDEDEGIDFDGEGFEDDDEDEDEDEDAGDDGEEHGHETTAPLRPAHDEFAPELDLDRPRGGRSLFASKRPAHPTLDDKFFSIDEFNRETEELESKSRSNGRLDEDDDDDGEELDLFAPISEEPEAFDEEDEEDLGSFNPSYKDFFAPPPRGSAPLSQSKKRSRQISDHETADDAASTSNAKKSKTDSNPPNGAGEKRRAVSFNDSVRVKTIEARKNSAKERLELFKRLGMRGAAIGDNEDDEDDDGDEDGDEDEDGEDVDWDMERFDDVDGVEDSFAFGDEDDEDEDEDDDDDEDDPDATESDPDLDGRDPDAGIGLETIQRLKNDLFDDDEPESGDSASAASNHAKRLAALAAEIASFEAENVGQKDWTLMGEASARGRPKNSLLEEDLDFERMGGARAARAVTEETTKSLEDRIKARILEERYDDVVRRRSVEDDKPFLPSRIFELEGSKSSRSLAQIYEDEFSAARDGNEGVVDDRDGKLAKEHEELDKMWDAICYKLDALSNAHFTPKAPTATISTVSNVATTSLESALPTTASTSTLLAPEELLAPAKSLSALRDRSELTPNEKKAARTKERKKRKKAAEAVKSYVSSRGKSKSKTASQKQEKDEALRTLVKSGKGVTVVGKDSANLKRAGMGGKGVKPGRTTGRNEKTAASGSGTVSGASLKL